MICLRWIIFIQTIFKDGRKEMGKTLNYEVTLGDLAIAIDDRQLGDDELLKQKYGVLGGAELKKELEDSQRPKRNKFDFPVDAQEAREAFRLRPGLLVDGTDFRRSLPDGDRGLL